MASDQQILVTVILHHDQSKTLEEITAHTKKTGFYRDFPPEGSELVSWVVAMSYGFIIQLLVEPDALRNLNRFIEQKAWGAFRYEIFPPTTSHPLPKNSKRNTLSTRPARINPLREAL